MTQPDGLPLVESVEELLQMVELDDIIYYGVTAVRREQPGGPEDPTESTQLFVLHEGVRLEVRCRVVVETLDAAYQVDVASRFELQHPVEITEDVRQLFVEKVGLMAVYPYVRETITESAAKLRLGQPLMKLLRSGQVNITPLPPSEDQAPAEPNGPALV